MLNEKIESLSGIGKQRSFFLNKLNLHNKRDVLFYLPNNYLSIQNEFKEGLVAIRCMLQKKIKINSKIYKIFFKILSDQDYILCVNFFNIKFFNIFKNNQTYVLYGEIKKKDNQYQMDNPSIFNVSNEIIPIYKGLSSYFFNKLVFQIIEKLEDEEIIYNNLTLKKIFTNLHKGIEVSNSLLAIKYLEASFLNKTFNNSNNSKKNESKIFLSEVLATFKYKLSISQLNVCKKIEEKLNNEKPLKHFIYGEVGAGKTIVSIISMMMIIQAGYNAVLLAPTLSLANQHYEDIINLYPDLKNEILLLTSTIKKRKQKTEELKNGKYKIIIGTHALIFLDEIPNLGLIVIDEIHKFGVLQRGKLLEKATKKNILMLTATPIPRSLSMMLSKFMDYDTLESFRKKITQTIWIKEEDLYLIVEKLKIKKAYWVMPNIEENEKNKGIEARKTYLEEKIPNIYMLHGKMKDNEKIETINKFKEEKEGVLIATTIVEVGINIPDADLIIIENAENFGLSQLHQLRGRVGRSGQESCCILISKFKTKKIKYMQMYDNGHDISQKDLEIRGSGKITGYIQHGCNSFYFLTEEDIEILNKAIKEDKKFKAFEIFATVDINC
ncbi:DEAD/DEAH box helicase [Alphaproteobacteria bacterium endosymbiont of Tiliacea citrago]|uniref:DEAD/DEAH box helicase n=1 Tax=Alphaproteobacteria bacterium endosymbiont of Tiliacea citrago TaxID=3077944 RepID=UPI00313AB6D0